MWFKLLYCRTWIRDVFWLGPPAPKALGTDRKNTHPNPYCEKKKGAGLRI